MANWDILKKAISDVIKTNGNQEITGQLLQQVLLNIVASVGANATFAGIAAPTTNPGTPDGPVFWIASEPGVYSKFNSFEVSDTVYIFKWQNNTWLFENTHIMTARSIDAYTKVESDAKYQVKGDYAERSELSELSTYVSEIGAAVENKYEMPADGIPSTDLTSDLQTSISRADTIYDDYIKAQNLM